MSLRAISSYTLLKLSTSFEFKPSIKAVDVLDGVDISQKISCVDFLSAVSS